MFFFELLAEIFGRIFGEAIGEKLRTKNKYLKWLYVALVIILALGLPAILIWLLVVFF